MTKARDLANIGTTLGSVSTTELGYLDGVTSAIQTQIDGKQAANAAVSTTELGYLDGVTSAIQTQLDGKTAKSTLTTTGDIYYASSANTPARLGIGSSGQVLTVASGIPSWAAPAGGGKVLQVVQGTYSTANTTTSTTYVDSGLSVSITPSANTSKVLVIVAQEYSISSTSKDYALGGITLLRGSTDIASIKNDSLGFGNFDGTSKIFNSIASIVYLDSPSTTSSTTYKTQQRIAEYNANNITTQNSSCQSVIIAMEIGA